MRMSTKGQGKLTWSAVLNLVSYRPDLVPGWGLFHYLRNRPRATGELDFHILEYFGGKKIRVYELLGFLSLLFPHNYNWMRTVSKGPDT